MLMLPELDTYGIIRKFAEYPHDPLIAGAFLILLKRAKRRINWDLHDFLGTDISYQDRVALRLDSVQLLEHGQTPGEEQTASKQLTLADWTAMSDQQARDTYMQLLKDTGLMPDLDPDGSMNVGNAKP